MKMKKQLFGKAMQRQWNTDLQALPRVFPTILAHIFAEISGDSSNPETDPLSKSFQGAQGRAKISS